jgi:ABC-2 type transport system ATP-binding protein
VVDSSGLSLDLEVAEGSVFGLIGPNGAGKTTTIKTFMNLLKPTLGQCEVLGIHSRKLDAGFRIRRFPLPKTSRQLNVFLPH